MAKKDSETKTKKKRTRSPNFPYVDLEKAVERTRELYEKDKAHPVPITVVHDRWNYKRLSGVLQQTVAALKAYGLVEVSGSGDKREIKVSEAGRKIVLDTSDSPQLLKGAALQPPIFRHLWERYGDQGLPSDDVIREYLLFDHDPPFNEEAVDAAIERFKETVEYANLSESDIISDEGEGEEADEEVGPERKNLGATGQKTKLPPPTGQMKNFTFPLIGGDVATLQVPHPMSKKNFEALKRFLDAYEWALTSDEGKEEAAEESD